MITREQLLAAARRVTVAEAGIANAEAAVMKARDELRAARAAYDTAYETLSGPEAAIPKKRSKRRTNGAKIADAPNAGKGQVQKEVLAYLRSVRSAQGQGFKDIASAIGCKVGSVRAALVSLTRQGTTQKTGTNRWCLSQETGGTAKAQH